jgi:hypothetical protein
MFARIISTLLVMLHDDVAVLRKQRTDAGKPAVPDSLQGVSKIKVKQVLDRLSLGGNRDIIDAVFRDSPGDGAGPFLEYR